jgi:hypothetical protein
LRPEYEGCERELTCRPRFLRTSWYRYQLY